MVTSEIQTWLERYGQAWQARDANAFAQLFSVDATYYWGPFRAPQRGRQEIASAVRSAFSGQQDVRFAYSLLTESTSPCIAHWTCEFVRPGSEKSVSIDGIFLLRFDAQGLCEEFREWWHSDET